MMRRLPNAAREALFDAFLGTIAVVGGACTAALVFLSAHWIYQAVMS